MPRRRAHGSGTLRERAPGVWTIRVDQSPDPITGKRRRPAKTVRGTKKDAQAELTKMLARLADSPPASADVSVGELIDRVLEVRELGDSTRQDWGRVIRLHIRPKLGSVPLRKLTAQRLDTVYAELRGEGVSTWRILKAHEILSIACAQAVTWGWMTTSPTAGARRPGRPPKKSRAHREEIVIALSVRAYADKTWGLWFHLASVLGPRRGELAALTWADVDLEAAEATISKGAVSIAGVGTLVKATKTDEERTVPLDAESIDILRARKLAHRERVMALGRPWDDRLHVMTHRRNPIGERPVRPDAATHWFTRMRDNIAESHPAAKRVRLGDLRHMAGSEMLKAGTEIPVVAEILGHDPETLMANYAHVLEGRKREAIVAMAELSRRRRSTS